MYLAKKSAGEWKVGQTSKGQVLLISFVASLQLREANSDNHVDVGKVGGRN